jgi:opacity protein-like surface antigen
MKTVSLMLLVALVAASATAAHAGLNGPSQRTMTWDYSLQTRYTGSRTYDADGGSKISFNDDLGWGFGFGYNFDEKFVLGGIFSWRSVSYVATAVGEDNNAFDYSNWLDSGTLGLYGDWNILPKRITPYLTGAIGWTWIDTNISAGYSGGCYWDPWWGYICGNYPVTYGVNSFSYSIGGGLRLEVADNAYFRVGYEYDGTSEAVSSGWNVLRIDFGLMY